jgi:hypothetical protein
MNFFALGQIQAHLFDLFKVLCSRVCWGKIFASFWAGWGDEVMKRRENWKAGQAITAAAHAVLVE